MPDLSELLGNHTAAEVKGWVRSLRYFTFMGAFSTDHFEQDEELSLYLKFDGKADLELLLGKLGILVRGDGSPPSVIAGQGPYNVQAFPDILEPRDCTIAGAACYVAVSSSSILIKLGPGVTAARVADAQKIEALIDRCSFGSRRIDLATDYAIRAADL